MKLYALCDHQMLDAHGVSIEEFVEIAKLHDAKIIQYRNKTADISTLKSAIIKIRGLYDGVLIVNDHFELAQFCDGVHMGQDDLRSIDEDIFSAVGHIRGFIGIDKIFGISTHNEKEILEANKMPINYIGLGAYRGTTTKHDVSTLLFDKLDKLASLSTHPVGAIGGVRLDDKFEFVEYLVIGSGLL